MSIAADIGQLTVSSEVTISSISSSAVLPGAYINCNISKTTLFGASGIQYIISRDANNVIQSVSPSGNSVTQQTVTDALASASWVYPSGTFDCSFTWSSVQQTMKISPALISSVSGSNVSIGKHVATMLGSIIRQQPISIVAPSNVFPDNTTFEASIASALSTSIRTQLANTSVINSIFAFSDVYPTQTTIDYLSPSNIQNNRIVIKASLTVSFFMYKKQQTLILQDVPIVFNLQ